LPEKLDYLADDDGDDGDDAPQSQQIPSAPRATFPTLLRKFRYQAPTLEERFGYKSPQKQSIQPPSISAEPPEITVPGKQAYIDVIADTQGGTVAGKKQDPPVKRPPNRYVPVDNRNFMAYAQTNRIMNAGKFRKHGPKATW